MAQRNASIFELKVTQNKNARFLYHFDRSFHQAQICLFLKSASFFLLFAFEESLNWRNRNWTFLSKILHSPTDRKLMEFFFASSFEKSICRSNFFNHIHVQYMFNWKYNLILKGNICRSLKNVCKNLKMSFEKLGYFCHDKIKHFSMVGIFLVQNRFLLFYTSSQLNTQMASSSIQAKKKLKRDTIFHAVRQFSWMKNWFNNVIVRIRAKNFFLFGVPKNKLKLLCPL